MPAQVSTNDVGGINGDASGFMTRILLSLE
jgi:hypothetical protein